MRVVVVGCGLAGLTTAYFLGRAGAQVTVIDRATAPARETSFANGSMLTPSLADPWNAPGVLRTLFKSLGNEASPMLLRPAALSSLVGWGVRFLANSRLAPFQESFLANVRFARYSQQVMLDLLQRHALEFEHAPDGTIKVFRDAASFQHGREVASWLRQAQIEHRALTPEALLDLEPALAPTINDFAGAIHFPQDEVGNARLFCEAMANLAAAEGVRFRFSEMVVGVKREGRRIVSISTARESLAADAFVLAAGSYSWPLGKRFGIRVPVRPAKGYSITVPLTESKSAAAPRLPIVDDALHAAVVPLGGNRLRVAGTAEFAGFDTTINPARVANLRDLLGRVFPQVGYSASQVDAWCGLRPMTADGRPIIGQSKLENLYLNTGHGPLGWTLACGSGKALADLISREDGDCDLAPFAPDRF